MLLGDLCDYSARLLSITQYKDYCPNGLQVEGRPEVRRIATAVTASQYVLNEAQEWGADAVLVHHGYFWRNEDAVITGVKKQRIAQLLRNEISLLAYHLPLDAHAEVGNNTQLGRRLGFLETGRFGDQDIACLGSLDQLRTVEQLAAGIGNVLRRVPQVVGPLDKTVTRVAWCSGGAQGYFEQAIARRADAYITGEISEQCFHLANETGVAFIAAGHHATERYGIQALGEHLAVQFALEHRYFDESNPV